MVRDPGLMEHGGRFFHRPGLWWGSLGIILPALLLLILIGDLSRWRGDGHPCPLIRLLCRLGRRGVCGAL